MKKRIISTLTAMLFTGMIFTACGSTAESGDASSAGSGDTVTLKVWGSQEGQPFLKRMCESFAAANPDKNYVFNYGVVSEADAKKELLKDVSAGADVFGFASDQTGELVSAGALYRVTKNKDQIVANNTAPSIQSATVDGELYGYPYVSDTYFMYYDKSKFTEEEVLSLDTMLAKDIPGTTTNFAFDTDNGWYQSSFFFGAGCKLFGDDGTDPTMCDFNNDRGMLAGEYLIDLVKNPKYGANFDDGLIKAGFADGSIAAAVTGTWNATDIQASLGDNYAATKLPSIKLSNGEEVQLGGMANFKIMGVNAETKNPLDAMALAEWLTNYDNQVINWEDGSARDGYVTGLGMAASQLEASSIPGNGVCYLDVWTALPDSAQILPYYTEYVEDAETLAAVLPITVGSVLCVLIGEALTAAREKNKRR